MILEFHKTSKEVRTPTRSNPSDAGLDVYAWLPKDLKEVLIEPGQNKLVPTGLKFGIPHGYMLQVCNRSSMGAKRSLVVGAHIIDSGYDGEVFIDLHNIGCKSQTINHRDKIAQLILIPVVSFRLRESQDGGLYDNEIITISNRGNGSLGSTNKEKESHLLDSETTKSLLDWAEILASGF